MCNFIKSLLVISVFCYIRPHDCAEEDVSQGSGETEINEVVEGSKEDVEKEATTDQTTVQEELKRRKYYDTTVITSTTPRGEENITASPCGDRKESSSEEDRCRSTLVNYPFSASIQRRGSHYASGALIHKQHVITVAAEFYNVRETRKLFRVRLGSVDCKRSGVVLPIKLVEIHPSFVPGQPSFDVAVLRLATPVETTDYIKPISLSKVQKGVVSAKFLTTYWPRLVIHGEPLPTTAKERLKYNSMRVSTQRLIPWKTCSTLMRARDAQLGETSLCLKPIATHHSVCSPDVGAPVVADDGLWGITSGWISEDCSKHPSPTIFTRTSSKPVRTWLKSVIEFGSG